MPSTLLWTMIVLVSFFFYFFSNWFTSSNIKQEKQNSVYCIGTFYLKNVESYARGLGEEYQSYKYGGGEVSKSREKYTPLQSSHLIGYTFKTERTWIKEKLLRQKRKVKNRKITKLGKQKAMRNGKQKYNTFF